MSVTPIDPVPWGARRWRTRAVVGVGAVALLATGISPVAAQSAPGGGTSPLVPVDEQDWTDQADMTWDDYVKIRPDEWTDGSEDGSRDVFRGAVVLADFEDQPFLISQEPGEHPFGNPQPGHEPVGDVNTWMHEYLTVPSDRNGGQTITGYWMEVSHGRLSVDIDTFGPYTLPGKLHEYGLSGWGRPVGNQANSVCPAGDSCNKNLRNDSRALWESDAGGDITTEYDFIFYVSAAHDESSTWQEFGEMLFEDRNDVPAAFGPPGAENGPVLNNAGNEITNWAGTRYVEWTSWRAAANHWPNATFSVPRSSTQAESSGQSVYAHEFSHILGLPDNYNNPFADNIRNYTGYWEMMSRGTFNGPGGTHNRWQVPNVGGSGLGPHHTVHFKNDLGVLDDDEQLFLQRAALVDDGIAVVPLKARAHVPDGDLVGLTVALGQNTSFAATCADKGLESFYCPPGSNWNNYRVEVVDRVGNDSFVPGHGVRIDVSRPSGGIPYVWMWDPNPEDINRIDFFRPDGTPVPVVRGDPRQLDDATFHAGTDSGSDYEWVDEPNDLHFYVLDTYRNDAGELMYDVAVRNLDGAGDFDRDVELGDATSYTVGSDTALLRLDLTNTGEAGEGIFASDVFRVTTELDGDGWETWQPHEVHAASAGEALTTSVYATRTSANAGPATLTVTATSESDPDASASVTVELDASDVTLTAASVSAVIGLYDDLGALDSVNANALQARVRAFFAARAGQARQRVLEVFERDIERIDDPVAYAALRSIYETMRG